MEIQPHEFDLIVVGTGLQEALLAAYAFQAPLAKSSCKFLLGWTGWLDDDSRMHLSAAVWHGLVLPHSS